LKVGSSVPPGVTRAVTALSSPPMPPATSTLPSASGASEETLDAPAITSTPGSNQVGLNVVSGTPVSV
jgi:hypothetical protein